MILAIATPTPKPCEFVVNPCSALVFRCGWLCLLGKKYTYKYVASANNSIYGVSTSPSGLLLEMTVDVSYAEPLSWLEVRL